MVILYQSDKAATGSSRAAFIAGRSPKKIPILIETRKAATEPVMLGLKTKLSRLKNLLHQQYTDSSAKQHAEYSSG